MSSGFCEARGPAFCGPPPRVGLPPVSPGRKLVPISFAWMHGLADVFSCSGSQGGSRLDRRLQILLEGLAGWPNAPIRETLPKCAQQDLGPPRGRRTQFSFERSLQLVQNPRTSNPGIYDAWNIGYGIGFFNDDDRSGSSPRVAQFCVRERFVPALLSDSFRSWLSGQMLIQPLSPAPINVA